MSYVEQSAFSAAAEIQELDVYEIEQVDGGFVVALAIAGLAAAYLYGRSQGPCSGF